MDGRSVDRRGREIVKTSERTERHVGIRDTFIIERREPAGKIETAGPPRCRRLRRWQPARGFTDKRENTLDTREPMGRGDQGSRETALAAGHSRREIKHYERPWLGRTEGTLFAWNSNIIDDLPS